MPLWQEFFQVEVTESRCRLNFCFPASSKKIQRRILEFVLEFGEFRGWNRGNGSTRIGVGLGWFVAELCGGEFVRISRRAQCETERSNHGS